MDEEYQFDKAIWGDIEPIPQQESPNAPVSINYTPDFVEAHGYLRAIMQANEMSQRALDCCHYAITLNAANYSSWIYLRNLITTLKCDIPDELKFCDSIAEQGSKNYQLWNHRRQLITILESPLNELDVTKRFLLRDDKNYHVWSYRQFILNTFNLFADELDFVETMIRKDVQNNSAWNQRHYAIIHTTGYTKESISSELKFTTEYVELNPNNDSIWRYIEGMLHTSGYDEKVHFMQVETLAKGVIERHGDMSNALSCLVELYSKCANENNEACDEMKSKVKEICGKLATVDEVRSKYWLYRAERIDHEQE